MKKRERKQKHITVLTAIEVKKMKSRDMVFLDVVASALSDMYADEKKQGNEKYAQMLLEIVQKIAELVEMGETKCQN